MRRFAITFDKRTVGHKTIKNKQYQWLIMIARDREKLFVMQRKTDI
mgnify:CR=1 FL=1